VTDLTVISRNYCFEWLRMQKSNFCNEGIFKSVPKWGKYVGAFGAYVKKL
jgi:hypothetical protein